MATNKITAFGQVTLTDFTDSYSVHMTSEAHAFEGENDHAKAATAQTAILAYQGIKTVACTVSVGTLPTGLTAKVTDGENNAKIITFTATTALVESGDVDVTIVVTDPVQGELTYVKKFSWSIAFKGDTGLEGVAGADAITLSVVSSNGLVFKNSAINTTLTALIHQNGQVLSTTDLAAMSPQPHLYWFLQDSDDTDGVTFEYLSEHLDKTSITVAMSDFVATATYMCFLATEQPDPASLA